DPRHEWHTAETSELFDAILSLRTEEEAAAFFRDLCTLSELEALTHRWQVARLVEAGLPYQAIAAPTGASTSTLTRRAHRAPHGEGGYGLALERTGSVQTA